MVRLGVKKAKKFKKQPWKMIGRRWESNASRNKMAILHPHPITPSTRLMVTMEKAKNSMTAA
jgi:hypothetical protein